MSPSLWCQSGLLLQLERSLPADASAQLTILRGSEEARVRAPGEIPAARARAEAALQMAERLDAYPHMQVAYRELAGLEHGPMLPASLLPTLRLFTAE